MHDLVLSGDDQSLAAAYPRPGREADPARAWAECQRVLAERVPKASLTIVRERPVVGAAHLALTTARTLEGL